MIGGPFDGTEAVPHGGFHRYLSEDGRAHLKDGPGRELYRRLSTHWRFAGYSHRECVNCGAVLERPGPGEGFPMCMCGVEV